MFFISSLPWGCILVMHMPFYGLHYHYFPVNSWGSSSQYVCPIPSWDWNILSMVNRSQSHLPRTCHSSSGGCISSGPGLCVSLEGMAPSSLPFFPQLKEPKPFFSSGHSALTATYGHLYWPRLITALFPLAEALALQLDTASPCTQIGAVSRYHLKSASNTISNVWVWGAAK